MIFFERPHRIALVEHFEGFCYTIRSARKVWLAPISDKTEVELRRVEVPLLGSDLQRRMQSHCRAGPTWAVVDMPHMIFEAGDPICRQLR